MGRPSDLLTDIESGALDAKSDLPSLLRKCISLGGVTGSEGLRSWATLELKGYGPEDVLPPYRHVAAPLLLDGVSGYQHIRGQMVPANMIPEVARDKISNDVPFRQPIAELAELVQSGRSKGDATVNLGPPLGAELAALINHELGKAERHDISGFSLSPNQVVERVYWAVSLTSIASILDVVRTTLVELVAEMRAGTPLGQAVPSREITEQAVGVAIQGKRNRVVINQVAPNAEAVATAGGMSSTGGQAPETPTRRLMWWVVGISTVLGAVAALWALFIR